MQPIERHLTDDDLAAALRADVRGGLRSAPKALPPKWFYDERGSALFEEITALDAYYPTRAETALLVRHAPEVAAAARADTLLELGAGSGRKTRLLLDALSREGSLRRFVPVDVSGDFLEQAARELAADHPAIVVAPVAADFERHLHLLPSGGRRLVAMLGSTIGNLVPEQRAKFLGELRAAMGPGDTLLLGVDLVKDPARLVAAYDDPQGVTAAFNRNVLLVLNRELGADFVPAAFDHVAVWDPDAEWIEMRLRARAAQRVGLAALGMAVPFAAGEELRTETSAKFRRERIGPELAAAGFALTHWWGDGAADFALLLAEPC
ncbi:L-histidine N-alpha-methyltransferase [Murinocardiopsis flavida]|uniref:Histidine N-alpha-methyltransferase n=1 Tax=Murinocardiopsis flavida TaxID=645275 RepID=A0A2P8DSK4_9ACTN|nr:L-histidine N(alpha)-methyltransferase [Murinocardiopsis flavida]PSL00197.1 L-histidine N-alpha-methyltransferase [Murinocardiopsis flavida]